MKRFNIKFSNRCVICAMGKIDNSYDGRFDVDYTSSAYITCNHRNSVVFLSAAVIPENI